VRGTQDARFAGNALRVDNRPALHEAINAVLHQAGFLV
jgi:crotonobetainyl-CoA:carnitine CoA-transferase CaiB-like acyl-CoA transferase